jgi:catalase
MARALHEQLVDAFDALFGGAHAGTRAAHAKGICCVASFTATPEAASLTRAPHMQGSPVRATVRFSKGSGDPGVQDNAREPHGMAVKFHLEDGDETDIVSVNHPVFIVRTPEEFLEFVHLRTPDPSTGEIDVEALLAFVGARPETARAGEILLNLPVLESFFRSPYYAIHAFRFIPAGGSQRFGRYYWEPELGASSLSPEEAAQRAPDYLRDDVSARLAEGPAAFTLSVQLANEEDDPVDPTTEWPDDRERIAVGRLEITGPVSDQVAGCERLVFDPMHLCDGIEASDDPILRIRPRAYSVSIERRLSTS